MGRMQPKIQDLLLVKTAKENQNAPAWGMAKDAPPHVSARVAATFMAQVLVLLDLLLGVRENGSKRYTGVRTAPHF